MLFVGFCWFFLCFLMFFVGFCWFFLMFFNVFCWFFLVFLGPKKTKEELLCLLPLSLFVGCFFGLGTSFGEENVFMMWLWVKTEWVPFK